LLGEAIMILGMSTATFTLFHVVLSLIAIVAGLVVIGAMVRAKQAEAWTAFFLATTVATSATGSLFHSTAIGPPHIVGAISLVILAAAIVALYQFRLRGAARWIYVLGAVVALYLNVFVGVVQAFQKVPVFRALAPTQTEPPFLVAQLLVLAAFVGLGVIATKRFHPVAGLIAV
jgi:hypothetical protein